MLVRNQSKHSDDSDDEDNVNLDRILDKYKSKDSFEELGNTEQYLINVLNRDANTCLICIETITIKEPVWNCDCCFEQFHLPCIQSWIKDGAYLLGLTQTETKKNTIPWNCPKCRQDYSQIKYPSLYYCYCRKVKDPTYDAWSVPHSCNQTCDKEKPCGHHCLLLCHPGPCPPCPKMVQNTCHCSKSSPVSRRCSNKNWTCNNECNQLLTCKQHRCTKICHPGQCHDCNKTSVQFCRCKKSKKEVLCTQTIWNCEEVCNKPFSCGHHKCELVCHDSNECGFCPRTKVRTCPCSKSRFLKPCTDEIPPCGDTCDKLLDCNVHRCVRRCHNGPCDLCRQIVTKKCRCGAHQKELPCCTQFSCETKCTKLKNCSKHKCNKKCCESNCAPCEQMCNKLLSCKNHKCNMLCHRGPCYPCPLQLDIFCPCGSRKLKVSCAKSKMNIKVTCRELCKKPADCHHEKRQNHRCHESDCPPCSIRCSKVMSCSHICEAICHTAVRTEIIENKIREGPWEPIRKKIVLLNKDCPPCLKPVKAECFGKHEISEFPCYTSKPFNCGRKCGNQLKCTHHKCEFPCHIIMTNEIGLATNCYQCERPCEQTRPNGCIHDCPNGLCHPERCKSCKILIRMRCHCNSNVVHVECQKYYESNRKDQEIMKSCKVPCTKNIECGHQCTLLCHSGSCSKAKDCHEKVTIKCKCKTAKKVFQCNETTQKLLQNPIDCTDKCDLKKNKSSKKTSAIEESEKQVKSVDDSIRKENKFKALYEKNSILFYIAFLSLFIIFISMFLYYYF